MVTSHLGRPTGGRVRRAESLAPGREAPVRAARHRRCRSKRDWLDGVDVAPGRRGRAARELPLQQGREEERRGALAKDGGALRRLRERRVRHRASRGSDDARHRAIREGRLRRPADGRARSTRCRPALENPARPLVAIVGGSKVSTKLTILAALARQGRSAHRRRRHRQHVPARGRRADRQVARRTGARRRGAQRSCSVMEAKGGSVPIPIDVVCAKALSRDRARRAEGRRAMSPPTI